jgi:hypothetical protein
MNKYSTIIITKETIKKLTEARNKYKKDNKIFSNLGLGAFILYLLDNYNKNEKV